QSEPEADDGGKLRQVAKALRFSLQGERKQEDKDGVVAVEQHLQRRIAAQQFLAIGVVEGAPIDAEKDHEIAEKILATRQIQLFPVNSGAFENTANCQSKTNPAHRRHALAQKAIGHDSS